MNTLTEFPSDSSVDDLPRSTQRAATAAALADTRRNRTAVLHAAITIRRAGPEDDTALIRLAELDSSRLPDGPILAAEVDGELRAALSLADGATVADPFHPTVEIVDLLETWRAAAESDRVSLPRRGLRHVFSRRTRRNHGTRHRAG